MNKRYKRQLGQRPTDVAYILLCVCKKPLPHAEQPPLQAFRTETEARRQQRVNINCNSVVRRFIIAPPAQPEGEAT